MIGIILAMRGFGTFVGFAIIAFTGRVDPRIIIFFGFAIQVILVGICLPLILI